MNQMLKESIVSEDLRRVKGSLEAEQNRQSKWLPSSDKLYIFKKASFDSSLVHCIYLADQA
jgi:hypothetical protein